MARVTKQGWIKAVGAASLLAMAAGAAAQTRLTTFEYPIRPVPGVFFDGTQGGTGLTVDTVPLTPTSDFVFSAYYHYNPDGSANWLTLGAPVTLASVADYTSTGISAYVRGQWLVSTGGQCFDCAYTPQATTNSAWGERQLNVVGARHLVMPASGNAPVRNMKLSKDLQSGYVFSQALIESGAVWQVKYRAANGSTKPRAGWVRFRKRPTTDLRPNFLPYDPAFPPLPFLDVSNLNALQQYEAVAVRCWDSGQSVPPDSGAMVSCFDIGFAENVFDIETNPGTFVIDPNNDRVRVISRCTSGSACLPHVPSLITSVADVIEAGKDAEGLDRLVIRNYALGNAGPTPLPASVPGWNIEYELTRVSQIAIKEVWPNGVPWTN